MKLLDKKCKKLHTNNYLNMIKILFILFLLCVTLFIESEVYASSNEIATYGEDYFGKEYSNGYISYANVIGTSSGVNLKLGKEINSSLTGGNRDNLFYTSNNTSKSEYIDYSKAARYINSDGEPIWLDMRVYIWTNNKSYSWSIYASALSVQSLFPTTILNVGMEFHFYTVGYCGNSNYEQSFKGVIKMSDLDAGEGFLVYSGYNKLYIKKEYH